ncbi:MAG: DEAD/DEAH box helicase family protein, partial [Collinsella sp.]|nr:DEAD/DEAH box helicase family protein [Collinsella sp.]
MEADIEGIFEEIIEESTDTKQQGSRYERAVKFFLENDPAWSSRLEMVWLWKDAPTNDGSKRDLGIDLVALDYDGSYWAVQAKCYSKKRLYEGDVTTFIGTAALDSRYDHLMIADSVQEWSQNLLKVVHNEHNSKDVVRVSIDDIKAANLGWNAFVHGVKPDKRKVHEPLPHQGKAIEGVKKTLNDHDRCSVFMACGTGKTLMALRAAEELCPGGTVLFLAPSISLVSQSMRAWSNEVREKINP